MALKFIVDALDDVPEALHGLYVEREGKFHLDVEGVVSQDRLREFRDNNVRLMKEIEEHKKKLATYGDVSPDDYQAALKKIQDLDDKKLIDEGKIEEVVQARTERLRTDYETRIKGYETKIGTLESGHRTLNDELKKERIDGRLRQTGLDTGIKKEALPFLIDRGRHVWDLDPDNGEPIALENGQPLYGKDPTKRMSMKEWVESVLEVAPFLGEASGGGGAQNQVNGGVRGARVVSRGDPLSIGKNLEDIASGKVVVR